MSQFEQTQLLEEIRDLLKEIQDNTRPTKTTIGSTVVINHLCDQALCNCEQKEMQNRNSTVPGWTCPMHGYQTG